MQTTVQFLIEKLSLNNDVHFNNKDKREIINQALEHEKNQIILAYQIGKEHEAIGTTTEIEMTGEQYYNQTYNP